MHKKLAADLTSLAHSILQMKKKDDVFELKQKAYEIYEKLSVLAYVEEYINNTPNPEYSKEELIEKIESASESIEGSVIDAIDEVVESTIEEVQEKEETAEEIVKHQLDDIVEEVVAAEEAIEEKVIEIVEEVKEIVKESSEEIVDEVEESLFSQNDESGDEEKKAQTLDEELKDTIAVDVVADLFEATPKKSLNDKLQGDIQIGLNDRIAFVKNLFDGSQEDFNRVVSQLNTLKTEKEAKKFINKVVKPDYDWTDKEEFEERFIAIVERKFT